MKWNYHIIIFAFKFFLHYVNKKYEGVKSWHFGKIEYFYSCVKYLITTELDIYLNGY